MPYADVNGQRIHYVDTGGDGPPVVWSHGFLMDHEMFAPQLEAFGGELRCIAWDERGFGSTEWDGKPFTYWDLADDVIGLLDHLDLEGAALVGMSQGGFLSLRAALRHPDRVRALVLEDTQAGVDDDATLAAYRAMHDEWVANGPHEAITGAVASIIIGEDVELRAQWIAKWQAAPAERLTEPFECLVGREDITDRMGEIEQPALVVHGTADAAIPMARAEALAGALPGCSGVVAIEGASHAPNLTHPEQFNAAVGPFLREHA